MNIVIIGGGAAGCTAAIFAKTALPAANVTVTEHSGKLMRKLAITGKGRCNITNNCDNKTLSDNITRNPRFLYGAFAKFGTADTMTFFENELRVPLKTERGGRVFPVSDRATDIVNAIEKRMSKLGVNILYGNTEKIICKNDTVTGVICGGNVIPCDKVIIAAGGMSYPKTGSDGSGYKLARQTGHTVTRLTPALVPIETRENVSELSGLSLKNVKLTLQRDKNPASVKKTLFEEQGEMLFTHFGISGPLVLSASSYLTSTADCTLYLDMKPALSREKLDLRILRDFDGVKNKQLKNSLDKLLPKKFIPYFIKTCGLREDKAVNGITKAERARVVDIMKHFPLTPAKTRPIEEAVVTCGGIDVKEVDPKTMESKLVRGLYFAGEILDVCGLTGGFNLQIAFSTAYSAAQNCGK